MCLRLASIPTLRRWFTRTKIEVIKEPLFTIDETT